MSSCSAAGLHQVLNDRQHQLSLAATALQQQRHPPQRTLLRRHLVATVDTSRLGDDVLDHLWSLLRAEPEHVLHRVVLKTRVKASSYIAQYPVLRTVQSALHFTSLTDLFTQTPFRLLWEASSHMLQLMHEGCSYTYPPLSIARYSFIQLSEPEQCRVKKLAQGFNTAAQDSNPGSRSRESEGLALSHGVLQWSRLTCSLQIYRKNYICKSEYMVLLLFIYLK